MRLLSDTFSDDLGRHVAGANPSSLVDGTVHTLMTHYMPDDGFNLLCRQPSSGRGHVDMLANVCGMQHVNSPHDAAGIQMSPFGAAEVRCI